MLVRLGVVAAVISCVLGGLCHSEGLVMDFERDVLSLNGKWQCLREHGDEEVWKPEVAETLGPWSSAEIPGPLLRKIKREEATKVRSVWARRTFSLDKAQAARDVVLKWGHIRHGATVWVNGKRLGRHVPIGPHTILLPAGAVREGENQLLLKVPGWGGIPMSKSGKPLIPTGSGTQGWGMKRAGIFDDIWLEFYDRAYIKRALAMPDVKAQTVTFRVWIDGAAELPEKIDLLAQVRPAKGTTPAGQRSIRLAGGKHPVQITVPVKDAKLWTPQTPFCYQAELRIEAGGKLCDEVRFRFGMRQIEIGDGHYRLNGKPLWFRGSNLVNEWLWGDFVTDVKEYLVDEARVMNLNSFRTHTLPPETSWLNVCDEQGTMIWAELPVLYNNRDFKFAPDELKVFHENALLDSVGWLTKLWNHPSLMIWVLSNESIVDKQWEAGPYWQHVRSLDPTRPAIRAGDAPGDLVGTPDVVDMHTCGNYSWGAEGRVMVDFSRAAASKDPQRPLSNSEYMNGFGKSGEQATHWLGRSDHPYAKLNYAEFAMEHTEAMRRHNFDGILPYMYAGWTRLRGNNWRSDYPTAMAAALHSSMAPVLASLDLFDRNFEAGQEVTTRLFLINEQLEDVPVKLELYLTPEDPMFVPDEAALKAAVWQKSFQRVFKAAGMEQMDFSWQVPQQPGLYYLAAVVRRSGDKAVVSQRVVRGIKDAMPAGQLKSKRVVVLGADQVADSWLRFKGISAATSLTAGKVDADVVVVWDVAKVSPAQRAAAADILKFAEAGGKLIILEQSEWPWKELVDFETTREFSSRAFVYPGVEHSMLTGVDAEYLKRWNGLPGRIADKGIGGSVLAQGRKLLWIEEPKYTIVHSVPTGQGEIVICFLKLKDRILKESDTYDPVADIILANLIGR